MQTSHLRQLIPLIILVFLFGPKMFSQEKLNVSAGLGFPELFNAGIHYQLNQFQFGVGAGSSLFTLFDSTLLAFSADVSYHFGGSSELSFMRPWYGKTKLMYLTETKDESEGLVVLSPRLGRDFNISKKVGIAVDAGLAFRLNKEENPISEDPNSSESITLNPAFGLALFYRL